MNQFIIVVCVLVSALIVSVTRDSRYYFLFMEPLVFALGYACCRPLKDFKFEYLALGILFITGLVRYVIVPFVMAIADYPEIEVPLKHEFFTKAILLQVYEEIFFFMIISYFAPRIYTNNELIEQEIVFNSNNRIINSVIIIGFLMVVINPELIARFNFVPTMVGNETEQFVDTKSSGWVLVFGYARMFFVVQLLIFLYNNYCKTNRISNLYVSLIIVGVNSMFVHDFSRFSILQTSAIYIYLLFLLYPQQRKKLVTLAVVSIGASVIYTTFIKMFSEYRGGSDNVADIEMWALTLQMYFQGVSDVAIGLCSSETVSLPSYLSIFNDAFANTAFLSQLSERKLTSIYLYNVLYSGGWSFDKILPNVCAGYNYFSFLGAPIITSILCVIAMRLDAKCRNVNDVHFKFIFAYGTINCAFPFMIYYPMTIGAMINNFLVMWLLLKLNKKYA